MAYKPVLHAYSAVLNIFFYAIAPAWIVSWYSVFFS